MKCPPSTTFRATKVSERTNDSRLHTAAGRLFAGHVVVLGDNPLSYDTVLKVRLTLSPLPFADAHRASAKVEYLQVRLLADAAGCPTVLVVYNSQPFTEMRAKNGHHAVSVKQ